MPLKLAALVVTGVIFLIADASVVDAALIAAISSTANTWILLHFASTRKREREERKRLRAQVRDLQRQMHSRRTTHRADTDKVVVVDSMPLVDAAMEVLEDDE